MILHQYPGGDGLTSLSPPCVKIEMALRRIGAEHRVVVCRSSLEAKRVSPSGRLPVLELDGERLFDSQVILDELERRHPESDLFPREPRERTVDRLWEHYVNDNLYWHGVYMRWVAPETSARMVSATFGRMPFYMRWLVRATFLPSLRARAKGQGIAAKSPESVVRGIERGFDMLEAGLDGGPFLQGRDRPGRGDLAGASLLAQLGFRDTMPDIARRLAARPALVEHVRTVYDACRMDLPRWFRRER